MAKKEKNKVGRPKLADTKLKKESMIIVSICMVIAIILIAGGLITLNIVDFPKLKGSVTTDEGEVNSCAVETVSDSYIRLSGNITQDYGDEGVATMTFTSSNKTLTKEINVKTDENTMYDFAIPKGEYTLTITKENFKVYETNISESTNNLIKLKYDPTKRTYTTDDEIYLEDECFHVMSDDGTTIKAMAKYNLLIGNEVVWPNTDFSEPTSITPIDSSTPGYGHQSSTARAALIDNTTWTGTLAFADRIDDDTWWGYWAEYIEGSGTRLKPEYGSDYPTWVFDSNSNLWQPLQNYKYYLQSLGYSNVSVTLPSYEDMIALGCSSDEYSCLNAPEWTYTTSYWLGSAYDDYGVWLVDSVGRFGNYHFCNDSIFGLRPVITISKSDL